MALYNVGDRVVVREDLGTNDYKYRYGYGFGMERFCGKVAIIKTVNNDFGDENSVQYKLEDDEGNWLWGSADFVGLADDYTPPVTQQAVSTKR